MFKQDLASVSYVSQANTLYMLKIYSTVHNTVITHLLEHREQDMQTERCLPFFCSWFELSKILESILSNEQADERAEWQGGGGEREW